MNLPDRSKGQVSASKVYDISRASGYKKRLYHTAYWQRLRQRILWRDPLCMIGTKCDPTNSGQRAPSTCVDHIIEIDKGGDDSDSNLQGACQACHTHKTRAEHAGG